MVRVYVIQRMPRCIFIDELYIYILSCATVRRANVIARRCVIISAGAYGAPSTEVQLDESLMARFKACRGREASILHSAERRSQRCLR